MQNAGNILKALRERFGYIQETVAEFLEIKRELVSMYETGEREMPIDVIEQLSNLFGIEPDVFFAEDAEEATAHVAFAFRKDEINVEDLKEIALFGKIVKNYLKIKRLNGELQ